MPGLTCKRYVRMSAGIQQTRPILWGCAKASRTTMSKVVSPCSPNSAFKTLKQPYMSAPGAPGAREGFTPSITLWGNNGNNRISQYVDSLSRTIVNTTLEGHQFYPGTVTWQVTPGPFGVGSEISVSGTGTGPNPMWNNFIGMNFFGNMAALIGIACEF